MNYAAQNGYLHILKYAHANGCQWDTFLTHKFALENGNQEMITWLKINGCPF